MSVYLFFKHRRARLTLIYSIFYANYLNLITLTQFKVLRAIAIERKIDQSNSGSFLARHALGAASTVAQAVESLVGKEFIHNDSGILRLQDKFFAQWFRLKKV